MSNWLKWAQRWPILLVLGLHGCGGDSPPPPLQTGHVDSRVETECMRRLQLDHVRRQFAPAPYPSNEELFSMLKREAEIRAYAASRRPADKKLAQAAEESQLAYDIVDRDLSRCKADHILRKEVEATMKKEGIDWQKKVKEGDRYNAALTKCGNWRTDEEYRAMLKCMKSYGF